MDETKKEVKVFSFYGDDVHTASDVASKMRRGGEYHAVWHVLDTYESNGYGWYVKYIEKGIKES